MDGEDAGRTGAQGSWRLWNLKPGEWRTAGWLGALLVAGLLLLFARPAAAPSGAGARQVLPVAVLGGPDPLQAEQAEMDRQLTAILGRIAGAGTVSVQVHLAYGPVTDYALDTQVSDSSSTPATSDGQGGTQHAESDQVVLAGSGTPAVRAVQAPAVDGVLVVATGASDPVVGLEIEQAVQAATGAPAYRIVVLPASGGER